MRASPARDEYRGMSVDQSGDLSGAGELREQVRAARLRLAASAAELGALMGGLGEYAESERLLRQAVELYEADCGATHPRLAVPLHALGAACAARGRLAEAERLYRRALRIVGRGTAGRGTEELS
jgi:tetratricopeptide (TPR) repeat protein